MSGDSNPPKIKCSYETHFVQALSPALTPLNDRTLRMSGDKMLLKEKELHQMNPADLKEKDENH